LGELEPGTNPVNSDPTDAYGDFDWAPEVDGFGPDPFENFPPQSEEEFNPEPFETDGFASDGPRELLPHESGSEIWEHGIEPTMEELSEPKNEQRPVNSLDTFKTEPDEPLSDWLNPNDINETSESIQSTPLPKVDGAFDDTYPPNSPGIRPSIEVLSTDETHDVGDRDIIDNVMPEQSDDILMPSEKTLPGYDTLEDWGEKSSPHKEFNPIQEHLNSLEQLDESSDSLLPAVSAEDDSNSEAAVEAISPHYEPLIGPLS
jgi:hypothetical protein